jgi:hypothetical protein
MTDYSDCVVHALAGGAGNCWVLPDMSRTAVPHLVQLYVAGCAALACDRWVGVGLGLVWRHKQRTNCLGATTYVRPLISNKYSCPKPQQATRDLEHYRRLVNQQKFNFVFRIRVLHKLVSIANPTHIRPPGRQGVCRARTHILACFTSNYIIIICYTAVLASYTIQLY